jgi:formylglycine-generating enzyme required for sulfatase activity
LLAPDFNPWAGTGCDIKITTWLKREKFTDPTLKMSLTPLNLDSFEFETLTVNRRGAIIERQSRTARYFREDLGNGVSLDMVYIPGGSFLMGAPEDEQESYDNERPQHEVTLQPFFMGKYAITQAQWRAVAALPKLQRDLDPDPSNFKGDNRCVEKVNWYDAVEFCARLSVATGRKYVLPSEAQWEYACRANTTTPFHFGETLTAEIANYDSSRTYADEAKGEWRQKTTTVGSFPPNRFGLYDMHGNVYEWCADSWRDRYEKAPTDGQVWDEECNDNRYCHYRDYLPSILNNSSNRILRGGSWFDFPRYCRSALRSYINPGDFNDYLGVRVVCVSGELSVINSDFFED